MNDIITNTLDAQGVLQPGEEGYWKIWGAHARDVQVGDLLMVRWNKADGSHEIGEYEIAELLDDEVIAPKFRATDGRTFRIGALQKIVLLRKGTHHTLP